MKLRKAVLLILICLFLLLKFKRSHCDKTENTSLLKNNDTILIKLCDDKNTCAYMNFSDNTAELHLKKHEFIITKDYTSKFKDKYLHYNEPLNLYFLEKKKKKWLTIDINGNLIAKNSVSKKDRQQFF